jgi:hypothetical protein
MRSWVGMSALDWERQVDTTGIERIRHGKRSLHLNTALMTFMTERGNA